MTHSVDHLDASRSDDPQAALPDTIPLTLGRSAGDSWAVGL